MKRPSLPSLLSRPGRGVLPAFLLLLALALAMCTPPAAAIGLSGAKYTGTIAPGGTDVHQMTISIGSTENPTDVSIEVKGFGQTPTGVYSPLDASQDTGPYSARSFITLDRTSLHLDPGTSQTVTATIQVPQNVGQGGRYALIAVHALPGKGQAFSTGIDIPIFVTIAGTTPTETGSILSVDTGDVTVGQPIKVTTSFRNTGNYHYYNALDWVTVKDSGGKTLANVSTAPLAYAIIPGNTIQFVIAPDLGGLQPGSYTVVSRVLIAGGPLLDQKTITFDVKQPYLPPVTESSLTVTPNSAGTLTSPDGRFSVSFPQGSVLSDVTVTLKPFAKENLRPAPAGDALGTTCFEITGLAGLLNKDATLRVTYSTDDLAAAGQDPSRLRLAYWDTTQNGWQVLATQLDTQHTTLTASTNHLSVWAVMVTSGGGSPSGTKTPLPVIVDLVALVIAIGGLSYLGRRRG
ncbi:MAG TPA: hypothetical protein VLV30_09180 [Methanomicrobiales archaeon]|nr:hypothetical protein [Methanomicrobiales archaeon]